MKLYYTDPLISAYMAREFGVEILIENPHWITNKDEDAYIFTSDFQLVLDGWFNGCISDDSLHIFEPMVGDLGIDREGNPSYFDKTQAWIGYHDNRYALYPVEIIRRNGKHFFTPKREI